MHTVFLVEDEPLIRQNLRNAIENDSDFWTCIGEAGDGELALSIIQDLKPDILITDIKMPFMDGISLARHAKAIIPWIRIIIVSGHDDFELAQQAICVGVDQYLLKPVATKDLLNALSGASEKIIEYKQKSNSFLKDVSADELVRNTLVGAFLEDICNGGLSADEALRRSGELGVDILASFYVVLIAFCEEKGGYPNRQAILSKVKFSFKDNEDVLYYQSGTNRLVLIVKGNDEREMTGKAYHAARTLKHEVEDDGETLLTVTVSEIAGRISGIQDAFHQADILLKTFGHASRGRIYCAADIGRVQESSRTSFEGLFDVDTETKLKFAVAGDVPGIVRSFMESDRGDDMQAMLYRYHILMDLTGTALRIAKTFNPDRDPGEIAEQFADIGQLFHSAITVREFERLATEICLKTIELRDSRNVSHHVRIVRKACDYIRENFHDPDICLNTVAASVGLSPAHFSTIFSQEMSETFIEYLTGVRMERVKELLASSDEKIIAIAFDVGYNEPNYLSYLFKKREGISPKEYRRLKRPAT